MMNIDINKKLEELKKITFSFFRVLVVVVALATGWIANDVYHRYVAGVAGIEIKEPLEITDITVAFDQNNNLIVIREKGGKNVAVSFAPSVVESIYNMYGVKKWAKTAQAVEKDKPKK